VISLKNIFYEKQSKNILNNINIDIDSYGITIITGHNGAGKSTLLKIISGIIKPTSGTIESEINILANSSFVFQKPIFLKRSVRDNIHYVLYNKNKISSDKLIDDYLKYFKLNHLSNVLAHNLSLGEQQLVSFIRAIIIKPQIIFLDEPTSNLDRVYKKMINDKISEISEKIKVFMITQNDTESRLHAKHPIVLERGELV
tara:strand:- start:502 stop:1101 length:600 start_codon:yes stop_codon:yes gene_type:complete